jgi:futalosine hydrolase
MNILIISATIAEIHPTLLYLKNNATYTEPSVYTTQKHKIEILVTGVGMVNTIFHLTNQLHQKSYDILINIGIGGAFDANVKIGSVFEVVSDRFGDIGAEIVDGSFMDIFDMGFEERNQYPYKNGILEASNHQFPLSLPKAVGITVNTVTGSAVSIEKLKKKYNADIESMEGAAFMYVAIKQNVAAIQLRAISNHIEPRNKDNWNIPLAIANLNLELIKIII